MTATRPLRDAIREPARSGDQGGARFLALGKLSLAVVLTLTTWFSATAVMPQLREHWHVTANGAVWLAIAVQLGFLIGAILSAVTSLSDILAPRILMAAASAGVGIINILLLVARTTEQAVVLRILTGMLLAGVYPPALKLISTWFQKGRGIALGCVIGALTLGVGDAARHQRARRGRMARGHRRHQRRDLRRHGVDPVGLAGRPVPVSQGGVQAERDRRGAVRQAVSAVYSRLPRPHVGALCDVELAPVLRHRSAEGARPRRSRVGVRDHLLDHRGRHARLRRRRFHRGQVRTSGSPPSPCSPYPAPAPPRSGSPSRHRNGCSWRSASSGARAWVADSAQFSAIVTESGARFVGTALTVQLGAGFGLTIVAILTLPAVAEWVGGWQWVFLALVPGPVIGGLAMAALRVVQRRDGATN